MGTLKKSLIDPHTTVEESTAAVFDQACTRSVESGFKLYHFTLVCVIMERVLGCAVVRFLMFFG